MAQQFEHSSEAHNFRAQRMTADESRAVIDLWQQERVEQTGLTDKPAVPDVAEGLDISVEDVVRLLQDVRAKRLEEERNLAESQRQQVEIWRGQSALERDKTPAAQTERTDMIFLVGLVMLPFVYIIFLLVFQK